MNNSNHHNEQTSDSLAHENHIFDSRLTKFVLNDGENSLTSSATDWIQFWMADKIQSQKWIWVAANEVQICLATRIPHLVRGVLNSLWWRTEFELFVRQFYENWTPINELHSSVFSLAEQIHRRKWTCFATDEIHSLAPWRSKFVLACGQNSTILFAANQIQFGMADEIRPF